jgi:predicted metalloprotease with PDZ domain
VPGQPGYRRRMVRLRRQMCVVAVGAVLLGFAALTHGATVAPFDVSSNLQTYLGVQMHTLTPQMADVLGVPDDVDAGAMVTQVYPRSPARLAGLRSGDVIVGVDGARTDDAGAVEAAVHLRDGGDLVEIRLVRDGAPVTLRARLGWLTVGNARTRDRAPSTMADTF